MRFLFLAAALLMLFAWIGAFVVFHVAAFLVHFLLLFALIFFILHLFRRRPA